MATKSSRPDPMVIHFDLDMVESIRFSVEKLRLCSNIIIDSHRMRLRSVETGIAPAVDLIIPIKICEDGKIDVEAHVVFDITDYSKF